MRSDSFHNPTRKRGMQNWISMSKHKSQGKADLQIIAPIEIKDAMGSKRMFARSDEVRMCKLLGPSLTLRVVIRNKPV
jgi:hypothetical protein